MTDMAHSVSASCADPRAVHIVQADASQCLLTAWRPTWRPTQVHEPHGGRHGGRPHGGRHKCTSDHGIVRGCGMPGGSISREMQLPERSCRSLRKQGTHNQWAVHHQDGPAHAAGVLAGCRVRTACAKAVCPARCVVQLRAQMSCSRCLETVSDRVGFCTHQHSLQVSKTVNFDACGASFAFGEQQQKGGRRPASHTARAHVRHAPV